MLLQVIVYCFVSGAVSWLAIYFLLKLGVGRAVSGQIQHHHTHTQPIPRIGGIGIALGLLVISVICFPQFGFEEKNTMAHFAIIGGALGAFSLGLIDDFYSLGAKLKLLVQILIAVFAYKCGLAIDHVILPFTSFAVELEMLGLFLTILWFVSVMNLINLIDGLDGLAGGIGLMLMVLLAYLGIQQNLTLSSILAFGMIGSILGFLLYNFPPAKCYMGDSGAYLIGYMIAALSMLNSQKGAVMAAMIGPTMALALPILDVAFALFRRSIRGLPLFRPDRGHIHHLLMKTGLPRKSTVLILYTISLFALLGGLIASVEHGKHLPIFLGFSFVVILFVLRGQNISTNSLLIFLTDSLQSRRDTRNAMYLKDWLIAEAERADRITHLWSDFQFIMKKMGICRAELSIGDKTREFYIPHTPPKDSEDLRVETSNIKQNLYPAQLVVYCEKENMSNNQFVLLADIASEAWTKASQRWQEVNKCPVTFDAVASDPEDHRFQKSRNLYRPTY